ncbi:MAG: hypothetical protein ABH871_01945 [Pseudomonadota bacterium]
MKKLYLVVFIVAAVLQLFPILAHAGYPMISGIPDQYISVNSSTGVIGFNVYDDETPADQLKLSYTSDTPTLVPATNANITLGGSGSERTVKVTPAQNQTGTATITIIVRDTDNETNQDSFEVEVTRQPKT